MRAKPSSVGKRTALPIAMSVPPASRNFANASTPSPPMPPEMSGDSPYMPRNLYFASFMYGTGRAAGAWYTACRLACCVGMTMTS